MSCPVRFHLPKQHLAKSNANLAGIDTLPTPVENATKSYAQTCTCIIPLQRGNEGLGTKSQSISSFQTGALTSRETGMTIE